MTIRPHLSKSAVSSASISPVSIEIHVCREFLRGRIQQACGHRTLPVFGPGIWLPDDLETEFDDKMSLDECERKREYVTSIERRGIKKGIAEIVSLQLQRRFGALNEAAQAIVSALAVEQVR